MILEMDEGINDAFNTNYKSVGKRSAMQKSNGENNWKVEKELEYNQFNVKLQNPMIVVKETDDQILKVQLSEEKSDNKTSPNRTLNIHAKSMNVRTKGPQCPTCNYKTSENRSLRRHIRTIHKVNDYFGFRVT